MRHRSLNPSGPRNPCRPLKQQRRTNRRQRPSQLPAYLCQPHRQSLLHP